MLFSTEMLLSQVIFGLKFQSFPWVNWSVFIGTEETFCCAIIMILLTSKLKSIQLVESSVLHFNQFKETECHRIQQNWNVIQWDVGFYVNEWMRIVHLLQMLQIIQTMDINFHDRNLFLVQ